VLDRQFLWGESTVRAVYRAVIFDFFGTLTQAVRRGGWHLHMARILGCDPAAFALLLDQTFTDRAAGGDARIELRRLAWHLGRQPTAAQVTKALQIRHSAVQASIVLRPDALNTLWRLHEEGVPVGLVSDCTEDLPRLMADMPVSALLDAAVYSAHVGVVKPHPALYLTACHRLGVDPTDCLYVGDGGGRELTGARQVGMTAVRLTAPDLGRHLTYTAEASWTGPTTDTLAGVLDLVLRPALPRPRIGMGPDERRSGAAAGSYWAHGGVRAHAGERR
jgi:putative hydrolase of the HAD superfamily